MLWFSLGIKYQHTLSVLFVGLLQLLLLLLFTTHVSYNWACCHTHKRCSPGRTCDGNVVTQHGFFTVSFYFYCVMTQSETHNVNQAWLPGGGACVCEREILTDCVVSVGKRKKTQNVCTCCQTNL